MANNGDSVTFPTTLTSLQEKLYQFIPASQACNVRNDVELR